jgi:predicted transcriptional regulator
MANTDGLDRLFFELASESRLEILRALLERNYKMQELARKLELTDTEAFRQLQRLTQALMIQKQPDGAYSITEYGKLVMQFSNNYNFAFKFKQCLLTRDVWRIPEPFINRLGELSDATLSMDTIEMVNNAETLISGAEKFLWIIGDRPMNLVSAKVTQQTQKGQLSVKFLFDENSKQYYQNIPEVKGIFEKRVIPQLPAILLLTEKYAGINLLSNDGRADNAIFYGKDPRFMRWATDFFVYFWEQGKHIYPNIESER